ncbi:hypothetical protein KFE25_001994 [Diacronema lutheri]|uniref:Uncharacterized protein n=1 Tax=Diacronema lutheri TaxID=2081491 RepID=A0A8J6CG17_DIALT|nr:hypothetical protein KFE25_001994 [Diacronema lutheri]
MDKLSDDIDHCALSHDDAYYRLLDARPLKCSINAWVGVRELLWAQRRSASAFDVLWYCLARELFDELLDFSAQAGEWARALAELLLIEYVFVRPDEPENLARCDALIRSELRAISLAASRASPAHIDRMLQLCPRLQRLDLSGSLASEGNVGSVIRFCADLEHINISGTRLGGDAVEALLAALPGVAIEV